MIIKTLLQLIILTSIINAQQFTIRGKIVDADSKSSLNFANIRVAETTIGTSTNANGEFELKLKKGTYLLIASFIGYYSDTLTVDADKKLNEANFSLKQSEIILSEVLVKPGANPALEIIRKAIDKKEY